MPYYFSPIIDGSRVGTRFQRVPVGFDQGGNWIVLGNRCVIWLPNALADARLVEVASDKSERLAAATRAELGKLSPDRQYRAADSFDSTIFGLLRNAPAGKWGNLLPSKAGVNPGYQVWLGPGGAGNNLFAHEALTPGPNTKTYNDAFTRSAALGGSTSTDGQFTWSAVAGSSGNTNGTQLVFQTAGEDESIYVTSADCDTDSMYTQALLVSMVRSGFTTTFGSVVARSDATNTNGYSFYLGVDGGPTNYRGLYAIAQATDLATDSTAPSHGSTIRVNCDGSSISTRVNGTTALGPVTNTGEASGSGNRRAQVTSYRWNTSGEIVTFDDYRYGDIYLSRPLFRRSQRFYRKVG